MVTVLEYFKTNDRETWTYKHFLNEIRETIIISPPYSGDWSGLDGAWYRRYIYHVEKSDPESDPEVLPLFSAPFWVDENDKCQQTIPFFQDILEREKRNAGKNYVIEDVRVLNEAVQLKLQAPLTNDILRIKPGETKMMPRTNVNVAEQKTSHRKLQKTRQLSLESDLSDLNAMFSSALKDWTVLEPSAEKCLSSAAISFLQLEKPNPIILEAGDLFYDGYIGEDEISHEEISPLDPNDHLDPNVACEMIAKEIPSRQNSEQDIDVLLSVIFFHVSMIFWIVILGAPSNAEGYHVDWMFTRHDLGKDLSWGREFSVCELVPKLKQTQGYHNTSYAWFFVFLLYYACYPSYVGRGYYASINLADFDIPTKYEELKSDIEISHIMLQVKKLLYTTITRFTLIKKRAEKEKLVPGRMLVPVPKLK
ncbi:2033_t:CDS:10, partial [Acaulospora morrowiae]